MGEFFALACGLAWAFAVILFRKSGETVSPLALNLFRVTVSSVLFLGALLATGRPLLEQAPWADYGILAASGVIAIAISDTLFHMCLNRVGAGISAIVDTFYSPFILVLAFFMLGETMGTVQVVGMVFILAGILTATRVQPPRGMGRSALVRGILLGVAAMATLAFGIVLAKPVLERSDVLWATAVRQFGSFLVLAPAALIHPDRRAIWGVLRPQGSWRYSLPGTVLGSFLALILWIAGMKHIPAGKAAVLNQTSTIYILLLAALLLKEPFTRRKAVASGLAILGVLLVLGVGGN